VTLGFDDQYRLAVLQSDFRQRVEAACVTQAIVSFSAPAISGVAQVQRVALANAILRESHFAVDTFAWVVVSRPQLNSPDTIADTQISNFIAAAFDNVAQQLMPGGP
jgi:hypothetical protein